jgi:hypothetical protein
VDGVDDLRVIDSTQVHRRDGQVSVAELALDNEQGHTLSRHLDGMGVEQLIGREATPHTRSRGAGA